jgi:hypothetical protein
MTLAKSARHRCALLTLTFAPLLPALAWADPPVTYEGSSGYAQPPPPRYVVPPPAPVVVERDPYDTPGIVVTGAGFGGLILKGDQGSTVAPAYLLHIGLAVGAAEFALRARLVPNALDLEEPGPVSLYATGATFNYRFIPGAVVHPVAGIGLESIVGVPSRGGTGHCFAGTARVGLELAFPLRSGALALGLDTTGHLPFAASESFPADLSMMLGFGAYLDYRF